eukprot:jgi/Ulvmu1/9902/UM057_0059.1
MLQIFLFLFLSTVRTRADCILIKEGTVVNHDHRHVSDVLVEGQLITQIAPSITAKDRCKIIHASGAYVMPGGIDPHTHLEMPFMGTTAVDDFFTGHRAALAGGTTMHIDFVLPIEGDIAKGLASYRSKAKKGCMDFAFHVAVTTWNDKVAKDMGAAVKAGVNSFKFFLAYKGALMVSDEQFLKGLQRCKELGALAMVHAENGEAVLMGQASTMAAGITGPHGHGLSRPAVLEGEATGRAIRLASFVNTPLYVVHVMSIDALDQVVWAQKQGLRVIGEPVVSGLALDDSLMWHPDFKIAAQYVMSPPIRSAEHRSALKKALAGGLLHLVATDHAVFNSTQKEMGKGDFRKIPNGVNGIEERMHVVWEEMVNSGLMSPEQFVHVTSAKAAQIFNVFPRKGSVSVGADADVIVLDPRVEHTISAEIHHSQMDTNVYEGKKIRGKVTTTISRGRLAWHNDEFLLTAGSSRFITTPAGGPMFHGLEQQHGAEVTPPSSAARLHHTQTLPHRFEGRDEL